ncbi:MAG: HD domain-containing protein [Clostridiaceae bacterium]|nr:HD domain-containing protein [Clostridiaceae bacterium]
MPDVTVAKVMQKMVDYLKGDPKRIQHAIKVHSFVRNIALLSNLKRDKLTVLEITALLHDIGIPESERKYNSTAGHYQEMEGPPVARKLLKDIPLEQDDLDRICYMIGHHHSYHLIDGVDFQILIEADFLVNLHEHAIDEEGIIKIREKYFNTKVGKELLDSMYDL